jgi:hypothetical protein
MQQQARNARVRIYVDPVALRQDVVIQSGWGDLFGQKIPGSCDSLEGPTRSGSSTFRSASAPTAEQSEREKKGNSKNPSTLTTTAQTKKNGIKQSQKKNR